MSQSYTGVIKKVFNKNGRWSLLMDDDNWYGFNRKQPVSTAGVMAEDGDTAAFDYTMNGAYMNAEGNTLKLKKGSGPAPTAGKAGNSYEKKEAYWDDKETRDIETQKKISMAGAINSSITIMTAALAADMIKFTGKEKYAAFQAMIIEEAEALYRIIQFAPANHEEIMGGTAETDEKLPEDMSDTDNPGPQADAEDDWT